MKVTVTDSKGKPKSQLEHFGASDSWTTKYLFKFTADDGTETEEWLSKYMLANDERFEDDVELDRAAYDAIAKYIDEYDAAVDERIGSSDVLFKILSSHGDGSFYNYELYVNGELDSSYYASYLIWNNNEKLKTAWDAAVKKYKDDNDIEYPSKQLKEKIEELKLEAEKQGITNPIKDIEEEAKNTVPTTIETAIPLATTDPCNFVIKLIEGISNGTLSPEDMKAYAKNLFNFTKRKEKEVEVYAQTGAKADLEVTTVEMLGTPLTEYYSDLDSKIEKYQKDNAETILLFKKCEREDSTPIMATDGEMQNSTAYIGNSGKVSTDEINAISVDQKSAGNTFTISDFIASNTAKRLNISNTPTKEHMGRIQETLKVANTIAAMWKEYCKQKGWKNSTLTMSSGYRNPELNKAVGGSKNSSHATGYAFDSVPGNGKVDELCDAVFLYCNNKENNLRFDQLLNEHNSARTSHWMHFGFKNNDGGQRCMYAPNFDSKNGSGGNVKYLSK